MVVKFIFFYFTDGFTKKEKKIVVIKNKAVILNLVYLQKLHMFWWILKHRFKPNFGHHFTPSKTLKSNFKLLLKFGYLDY